MAAWQQLNHRVQWVYSSQEQTVCIEVALEGEGNTSSPVVGETKAMLRREEEGGVGEEEVEESEEELGKSFSRLKRVGFKGQTLKVFLTESAK
nr:hypothetical protein BaRGS_031012 [Batillaria attramentaria]